MIRFRLLSASLSVLVLAGCTYSVDVKSGDAQIKFKQGGTTTTTTTGSPGSTGPSTAVQTSSSSSDSLNRSVWTSGGNVNSIVNGRTTINDKTIRYSSRSINGVETKLEAPGDVIFLNGKPSKWAAGAVVKLSEKRNGAMKEAELRPDGAQMQVWMKRGDTFAPGTADDRQWAEKLLAEFKLDDTPDPVKKAEAAKYDLDDPQFAQKLANLHYDKNITELIAEKAQAPALTAKQQIALIDLVFSKVHYDKDQKAILLQLIHRKDLSREASTHLLDNLDKIHYKADRKLIQRELFERASAS